MNSWLVDHGMPAGRQALVQLNTLIDWVERQPGKLWSHESEFNDVRSAPAWLDYLREWREALLCALTTAATTDNQSAKS